MKKLIAITILGLAVSANAQTFNFTNSCNYKLALQSVTFDVHPKQDESGDWVGKGLVNYDTPAAPTNFPLGVTLRKLDSSYEEIVGVYLSNSVIQAKAGSNDVVKVNKVLKDVARKLGADHKVEFSQ